MTEAKRLRIFILALLALAALLAAALFSVSYAKWDVGGSSATAESEGSVGKFYVEYPYSATLDKNTYYLEVVESATQSKYYPMDKQSGANEEYTITVKLVKDQTVSVCTGSASGVKDTKTIENKNSLTCYTLNNNNTATVNENGIYSFYYMVKDNEYQYNKRDNNLYANVVTDESNTFTPDVTIKCKDGDVKLNITVKRLSNVTSGDPELYGKNFYMYVVAGSGESATQLLGGYPGKAIQDWNYNKKSIGTVNATAYNASELIYVFGNGVDKAKTGDLSIAIGNYNVEFTFRYKTNDSDTEGNQYLVSGLGNPWNPTVYSEPDYIVASNTGAAVDEIATVRQVNAKITVNSDNKYVYHNYICVSRKNEDGAGDNSMAFLEFAVSDCKTVDNSGDPSVSPYDVVVKSVKITRKNTDANGNPQSGTIDPAPRLYNYEAEGMRLGPDPSHTAPDPNGDEHRAPIFAHGNKHDVSEGLDGEASDNHMQDHYDDGTYAVLFFGDGKQQYFALDIEIETDRPADFKLTVSASNINHWQRYESGYGKPWGLYLGGLINDVWSWDPRRTTEMTGSPAITGTGDVYTIDQDGVEVSYPRIPIDYSITVNLTAGSLVKPYLLDSTGYRRQENGAQADAATAYLVAKRIIAPDGLYDGVANSKPYYNTNNAVSNVADTNIYIPVTGEYTFRLKGNVTPGYSDAKSGWYVNLRTGETQKVNDGDPTPSTAQYWYGVPAFNFLVDELYISTAETSGEYTVTFDPNGGKWSDNTTTAREQTNIAFGGRVENPDTVDPTNGDKIFAGWYTATTGGTKFELDTPITQSLELFARWTDASRPKYTVTFYYNYTGAGVYKTYPDVEEGTTIAKPDDPTRTGYEFNDWYMEDACTNPWVFESQTVGENTKTLYAKWTKTVVSYTVTFNANGGSSASPTSKTVQNGQTYGDLASVTRSNHDFVGWFTAASGGTQIKSTDTVNISSNITLYAHWTPSTKNDLYVRGTMNNWLNDGLLPEYYIGKASSDSTAYVMLNLSAGDEFKIVSKDRTYEYNAGSNWGDISSDNIEWASGNNFKVKTGQSGIYVVGYNSGTHKVNIYRAYKYAVVGKINGDEDWNSNKYLFSEFGVSRVTGSGWLSYKQTITLTGGDSFKIRRFGTNGTTGEGEYYNSLNNGVTGIAKPSGSNNVTVQAAGAGTYEIEMFFNTTSPSDGINFNIKKI